MSAKKTQSIDLNEQELDWVIEGLEFILDDYSDREDDDNADAVQGLISKFLKYAERKV